VDEKWLKIELLHTGDELDFMSPDGILHCVVIQKQGMQVQVQDMKRPVFKKWLSASQVEFECVTKQELETRSESIIDDEDEEFKGNELTGFKGSEFKAPWFHNDDDDDDDPADWWKKGKKD